ncbi:MAG: hypothetical protein V2B18_21265 [Pseudomonadota bacterium]
MRRGRLIGIMAVMMVLVACLGLIFSVSGCAPFRVITGDATPADCVATKAYIDMCNTELFKDNLPAGTRSWYELALASAQIEYASKCAGVMTK